MSPETPKPHAPGDQPEPPTDPPTKKPTPPPVPKITRELEKQAPFFSTFYLRNLYTILFLHIYDNTAIFSKVRDILSSLILNAMIC